MELSLLVTDRQAKKKIKILQKINTYFSAVYIAYLFVAAVIVYKNYGSPNIEAAKLFLFLFVSFVFSFAYSFYNINFQSEIKAFRKNSAVPPGADTKFRESFIFVNQRYDSRVKTKKRIYITLFIIFLFVWAGIFLSSAGMEALIRNVFLFFVTAIFLDSVIRLISYTIF